MRAEDFGYDPRTFVHDKRLTRAEGLFVGILWVDHVGRDNAIPADDLANEFALAMGVYPSSRSEIEEWKRDVRRMQNHILRKHDHIPVLSMSGRGGGYFIAATDQEAERFYRAFRQRGMTGLVKATAGKKESMVEAVEQLAFQFEDMVDRTMPSSFEMKTARGTIAPEIVDSLLEKMSLDPEKFAIDLRKIREKFFSGAVLLEKERLAAMRAKTAELQAMINTLGG